MSTAKRRKPSSEPIPEIDALRWSWISTTLWDDVDEDIISGLATVRERFDLENDSEVLRKLVGLVCSVRKDQDTTYSPGIETGMLNREVRRRRSYCPTRRSPQKRRSCSRQLSGEVNGRLFAFVESHQQECRHHQRGQTVRKILREGLRLLAGGGEQVDEYLRGHYAAMELEADSTEEQAGVFRDHTGEECFWLDFDSYSRDLEQERLDKARQEAKQKEVAQKARAAEVCARAITRRPAAGTRAPRSAAASRRAQSESTGESRAGPSDSDGDDPPPHSGSDYGSGVAS